MTSEIEDEVNIAIEFFPGRVKRDEWVKQAKRRSKLWINIGKEVMKQNQSPT